MNPDNTTPQDDDLSFMLPVPDEDGQSQPASDQNPAADLVRQKVEAVYQQEPDAATEALDVAERGQAAVHSKHQKFIYELTMSGKSLPEIQAAWHDYYAGLTDLEKHQVWEEFYSAHAQASRFAAAAPAMAPKAAKPVILADDPAIPRAETKKPRLAKKSLSDMREYVFGGVTARPKLKTGQHVKSILFGLAIGSVVIIITLFSFFNERFVAPFIQPSRAVTDTPLISEGVAVGSEPQVVIPKINVEIPVVYGMTSVDENNVNKALESGVLHYANTSVPGQDGNVVIVGHSSNNIFNKGKYKFAFVLLSRMEKGDTFYLVKDGKKYTYQIFEKKIIKPTDLSVLGLQAKPATATLITCDPPGTSTNRLVVIGEQISPSPSNNLAQSSTAEATAQTAVIPGNAPSLWSRFYDWLPL